MTGKQKLIAVVGPTASGKTSLAIAIAEKYHGEIISCDSMQIYRGMPIGTAQPTEEELRRVKHHLVSFLDPAESFSVSDYVELASEKTDELSGKGILPVICGGTGLYARSLLYGVDYNPASRDDRLREELTESAENGGIEELYKKLCLLDPKAAEIIHINNQKRVIRALEYCMVTGEKFSEQSIISDENEGKYDFLLIGINYRDREKLYSRINLRVDEMMKKGLANEAESFYNKSSNGTAAQAIGYKELFPYFEGKISLEEAVENIKLSTRHYAKRQLTWFRKERKISWLYPDDYENGECFINACFELIEGSGLMD